MGNRQRKGCGGRQSTLKEEEMWYLIQRRGIKPREEWTVSLDEHLAWMKGQHESGRIL
jgi:hypothetical protein